MSAKKDLVIKRKVFINSKTGQGSVVIPKKTFRRFFRKLPTEIEIKIKPVKW